METQKWYVVDDQTGRKEIYSKNNYTKFETETIKSSLCDYCDAYVLVAGGITVNAEDKTDNKFKICPLFSTCETDQ